MEESDSGYLHGTHPKEQQRLSRLNALLNANSLRAIALGGGERILDVGAGLGQFSRMLARTAGSSGAVIGVEHDADQLVEAHRQAREDGEEHLVEFRRGDAVGLPLEDHEWGTFDVAHARFILEHVTDPLAVPLVFKDRLIGVLDLESTEPDYFTEEHEQMVVTLASHMSTALVNARLFERVLRDEQRLDRDLATARRTQLRLLPKSNPHVTGLEIGTTYAPAYELGGDFYDFLRYPDGRVAVAVGDVAGKATPAALLASMTVGLLRGYVAERPGEPAALLAEINDHLQTSSPSNRYVAMAFGVYDPERATLVLANAGFPRPLHSRDERVEEIPVDGVPLGMISGTVYREQTLKLRPGDAVVFCSDGLIEDENSAGDTFGAVRLDPVLRKLLPRPAQEIADGLTREARVFSGDPERQHDDYTVVVLKSCC